MLHHVRRLERARLGIALDLERGVVDTEMLVQVGGDVVQKRIAVVFGGHDQMRGQCPARLARRTTKSITASSPWRAFSSV